MSEPVIEEGVAPPRAGRDLRRWRDQFPVDSLKRGQSIFVTGMKRSAVSAYCSRLGKQYDPPKVFQTHVVTENGVEGVRVWRIE